MVYTLLFSSSKCSLFHNSNVFGSCIIHILYTECAKILKSYILYMYSIIIGNEYFKLGIYSPFFPLQNAVCLIILSYLVPVLFTFYIQRVPKFKKSCILYIYSTNIGTEYFKHGICSPFFLFKMQFV
jgi:hypothetical protein